MSLQQIYLLKLFSLNLQDYVKLCYEPTVRLGAGKMNIMASPWKTFVTWKGKLRQHLLKRWPMQMKMLNQLKTRNSSFHPAPLPLLARTKYPQSVHPIRVIPSTALSFHGHHLVPAFQIICRIWRTWPLVVHLDPKSLSLVRIVSVLFIYLVILSRRFVT